MWVVISRFYDNGKVFTKVSQSDDATEYKHELDGCDEYRDVFDTRADALYFAREAKL